LLALCHAVAVNPLAARRAPHLKSSGYCLVIWSYTPPSPSPSQSLWQQAGAAPEVVGVLLGDLVIGSQGILVMAPPASIGLACNRRRPRVVSGGGAATRGGGGGRRMLCHAVPLPSPAQP